MRSLPRLALFVAASLLAASSAIAQRPAYTWRADSGGSPGDHDTGDTLHERFTAPPGFTRVPAPPGTFAAWLRHLPLSPPGTPVLSHAGKTVRAPAAAVVDLDVGAQDLQQCADSILRLRAEYLWAAGRGDDIAFHFTNGDLARWSRWRQGHRPRLASATKTVWSKAAPPDDSYAAFRGYLTQLFVWAGTASLEQYATKVKVSDLAAGDFFVLGGFPGHAVLILDVVRDQHGARRVLLGQGFMPAQSFHVIATADGGVWWPIDEQAGSLKLPSWPEPFPLTSLRRFAP